MRELANTLFACSDSLSVPELSSRQQELLSDIVSSGAYGTIEKKVGSRLKKYAKEGHIVDKKRLKLQYLRKRFFPKTPGHRRYYAFYEALVMEVIDFDSEDVIVTSCWGENDPIE